MAQTKREKKNANRKKMAKRTRKEQHSAGIFKKRTQIVRPCMPCVRPPDNNQNLGGFLFGKVKSFLYICIMIFEKQLILEAQIYGVLSLVLISVMLWMVIAEKRKYDKTNGRKKK